MTRVLLCAALLLAAQTAHASDPWRTQDVVLEGLYQTALIADWKQTRLIAKNPAHYREGTSSGLFGSYPSVSDVNRLFVVGSLLHVATVHWLPAEYRTAFQSVGVTMEMYCIRRNLRIGLNVTF